MYIFILCIHEFPARNTVIMHTGVSVAVRFLYLDSCSRESKQTHINTGPAIKLALLSDSGIMKHVSENHLKE
jgi:hypothetical protein